MSSPNEGNKRAREDDGSDDEPPPKKPSFFERMQELKGKKVAIKVPKVESKMTEHPVYTALLHSGELALFAADKNNLNGPAYIKVTHDIFRQSEKMKQAMGVAAILRRRSDRDPLHFWSVTKNGNDGSAYPLYWYVFVRFPGDGQVFTKEDATKWGTKFANFLDRNEADYHQKVQLQGSPNKRAPLPNRYKFAGLTNVGDNPVHAIELLTATDIMSYVIKPRTLLENEEDVVKEEVIMKHYYGHETEDMTRFFLSMADSVVAAPAGAPKDPMDDLYEAFKDD